MSNTANNAAAIFALRNAHVQTEATSFLHDSSHWVMTHWLNILIATGIAILLVLAMMAVRGWALRLCRADSGGPFNGWGAIIGRVIARTRTSFMFVVAAQLVVSLSNAPQELARVVGFLFTIITVFQVAIWMRELILGFVEHRAQADEMRAEALGSALGIIRLLVTVVLFAIALIVVLSNLGVNVTGLVAGLGVGGIAIGLAAQGIFADLFAALSILFDRPFKLGDNIAYDNTMGTIVAIGLKSTHIRAFTGELRVISNKNLLDKEIQNLTERDHIRIPFTLGLAYHTPPEKLERVPALIREIVEAHGATAPRAGFASFGDSTLNYDILFDCPGSDWPTAHEIRDKVAVAILRRFADEGIEMAFPTQTTYTAAPDGRMIMPYPDVQPVVRVDRPGAD